MTIDQENEIFEDALYYFGYNHQATKAIEEMSELIKELCKNKDGADNVDHIAEEIADVFITLDQMVIYHDIFNRISQYREQKLERLRSLIFIEKHG